MKADIDKLRAEQALKIMAALAKLKPSQKIEHGVIDSNNYWARLWINQKTAMRLIGRSPTDCLAQAVQVIEAQASISITSPNNDPGMTEIDWSEKMDRSVCEIEKWVPGDYVDFGDGRTWVITCVDRNASLVSVARAFLHGGAVARKITSLIAGADQSDQDNSADSSAPPVTDRRKEMASDPTIE